MTTIYNADARELNMLIRRKKMTREEICVACNCSAEEFEDALRHVFSSVKAFKDISRALKNNARDAERAKNLHVKDGAKTESNSETAEESVKAVGKTVEEIIEPEVDEKVALAREKTALEEMLIPLEQSYQEDLSARRQILQEARDVKIEMEKLRKAAKEMMDKKYIPLMEQNNKLVATINQKGGSIREKRARYDAVVARISELESVYILVCDGEFLPEEPEIKLDFSGWEVVYSQLLQSEDSVFDLKKSQLKTVAESISARDNSSCTLVFEFDSKELEDAYDAFAA